MQIDLDALERDARAKVMSTGHTFLLPETLLALIAKVRELEQDAARLDWMASREAWIAWSKDGEICRVFHRDEEGDAVPIMGWSSPWFDTARAAIDAARGGKEHG